MVSFHFNLPVLALCAALAATASSQARAGTTWYVDDDVCPTPGTGTLLDPFCLLEDAVLVAVDGDTVEAAPGDYYGPITFAGKAISVIGAGAAQTFIFGSQAARIVSFVNGETSASVLRAFTLTQGSGGIECFGSSPTIEDCVITNCIADSGGGAIVAGGAPFFRSCTFTMNEADNIGGGVLLTSATRATLRNCHIEDNDAAHGAGLYVAGGAAPVLEDCTIEGNEATGSAGGISLAAGVSVQPTLTRCTIRDNRAVIGAGINSSNDRSTITDCLIEENIAVDAAGGINCKTNGGPTIVDSTIRNNVATNFNGGGIVCNTNSSPQIRDTIIEGNHARNGGGMYILDNSYPTLRGCQVIHNTAEPINNMHGFAGGIALSGAAAWWFMDQCEVRGNEADAAGGIGLTGGEPLISNTIIEQNSALRIAGGVLSNNGEPHLENCLIARNSAQYGGGLYAYNLAAPELVHCTVAKNSAPTGADVYAGADSHPVLINSILWGNTGDLLYVEPDCTISAEFTNLQGGLPGKGFKIMSLDPLFAGSEDFHLTAASPCINACEFEFFSTDLDGHPRTICELPDMGAYEFGLGDFNCDRVLNAADAAGWSICMLGPGDDWSEPACSALDANADDRVDLRDWAAIQNLFGAN